MTQAPDQFSENIQASPRVQGACHVYMAGDVGSEVDLAGCTRLLSEATVSPPFERHKKAPKYFNFRRPPLVLTQTTKPIDLGGFRTEALIKITIYEVGAVSVEYTIPLDHPFSELIALSDVLYDNEDLIADAKKRIVELMKFIGKSVKKPDLAAVVESYPVLHLRRSEPELSAEQFLAANRQAIAQLLSSETESLSPAAVEALLTARASYYDGELAIVTWDGAFLFGQRLEDVRRVLEFANVELLELLLLEERLDVGCDQVYDLLELPGDIEDKLGRIGQLMADGQVIGRSIDNALQLFGHPSLAEIHRLASESFRLEELRQDIKETLGTLETLHRMTAERIDHARAMRLEKIIILLFVVDIILTLISMWHAK